METTLGTVPGTVPRMIRGMSIQAASITPNASFIRCLARSRLACARQLLPNAWPIGLRVPKAASLSVPD